MISLDVAKEAVLQCLTEETRADYAWLLGAIDAHQDVFHRKTFPGHITVGAIVYCRSLDAILHIHHRTLDRWLMPGGHVEPTDTSLEESAARELLEETGLELTGFRLFEIDKHEIPANGKKQEPAHWHYDLRYLTRLDTTPPVSLQLEEVRAHKWIPRAQLPAFANLGI